MHRAWTIAVAAAVLAWLAVAAPARADDPIPPVLPTSSPSPSPSPSSSPSKPKPRPSASSSGSPAGKPAVAPKGPAPDPYRGPVSQAIEYWRNLPKTPARTTTVLLDLIERTLPPGAALDPATLARGVWPFPIAGYTWFQDDWAAPRFEPYFHLHEGTDLFATTGTPVVACADGVISKLMVGTIGGVSIWLTADDGTVYYYGHLRKYAPGLAQGSRVRTGQVIAGVGNSGIAVDSYPHVHFEIHPGGGAPVNPKPTLDRWLAEAEARAQAALRRQAAQLASARIGAARWSTLFDLLAQPAGAPHVSRRGATADAFVSRFADAALDRLAFEVDWQDEINRAARRDSHASGIGRLSPALVEGGILATRNVARGAGF